MNRCADQCVTEIVIQKGHLCRKPTGQTEISGVEPGDVLVPAGGDLRQASVQRGHNTPVAALSN
jgi:hypothetical protein